MASCVGRTRSLVVVAALVAACGGARPASVALSPAAPGSSPAIPQPRPIVRALTVGGDFPYGYVCEHVVDGPAWCSGNNAFGQLGSGSPAFQEAAWQRVDLPAGVHMLAAGRRHACAVTVSGEVDCWGRSDEMQLGVRGSDARCNVFGTAATCRLEPVAVLGLPPLESVALGNATSCALTRQGRVFCWGGGMSGPAGDGTPHPIAGVDDAVEIAAGADAACARRRGGTVVCWGRLAWGTHPADGKTASEEPRDVPGVSGVTQISAGDTLICALKRGGTVTCWGSGPPQAQPDVTGATRIAVGGSTACALTSGQRVLCWGMLRGAYGDRPARFLDGVVEIEHARGAKDLSLGGLRACVLRKGAVHCWGGQSFLEQPLDLPLPR